MTEHCRVMYCLNCKADSAFTMSGSEKRGICDTCGALYERAEMLGKHQYCPVCNKVSHFLPHTGVHTHRPDYDVSGVCQGCGWQYQSVRGKRGLYKRACAEILEVITMRILKEKLDSEVCCDGQGCSRCNEKMREDMESQIYEMRRKENVYGRGAL